MGDCCYSHMDLVNTSSGSTVEQTFLDVLCDSFLKQLVLKPTSGEAIQDLLLSNVCSLVLFVSYSVTGTITQPHSTFYGRERAKKIHHANIQF